jgi:DNA-directed RNA polymerase subunit beta'
MMSINNILSPANGKPIAVPSQDMVLGCYWLTKERIGAKGEGKIFGSTEEVRIAFDAREVEEHARIKVRIEGNLVQTTVGRVVLSEVLPSGMPFSFANKLMTKKEVTKLIDAVYRQSGHRETVMFLDKIKDAGFTYATRAGVSICIDNMHIPSKKEELIGKAQREVNEIERQYAEGLITNGERYNKVIDIWAHVTEQVAGEMMKELGAGGDPSKDEAFNPIFMMADSGARGSSQQIRQLGGMRGLMAKPSGEIIETPITANFREGLTVLQYFISTHGARKGLADTALKTANSGYLTRRLVDIAQDVIISEIDCGTTDGIFVSALVEGGEIIQPIEERILGRLAAEDIRDPVTGEVIVSFNEEITEERTKDVVEAAVDRVKIRSVLTCQSRRGVCRACYGRDLARGRLVEKGEPVGVIAAQSIGEPGTQLTMRTFHIGGTASKVVEQTVLEAKHAGRMKFMSFDAKKNADVHNGGIAVRNKENEWVVMNRNAKIAIVDENGREREKYPVVYGAKIKVKDGDRVELAQKLVEWDPYSLTILTEVGGKVAYGDIVEGVTMKEEFDEVTGLSRKVIIEHSGATLRPRVSIKDEGGKTAKVSGGTNTVARYLLPVGAHIFVEKGATVHPGDVLAKIPRETTKTKDITGGLPRVAELFEARKPKEQAVISEIDGEVSYGGFVKGQRKVLVDNKLGDVKEYFIPKGKHVNVHEGDWVRAGEPLMDGSANPHDILDVLGPNELQKYLVDEVQDVYRLQGVSINDKHIEIIVRQMLRKVRIEDPGDTEFLPGSQVSKMVFEEENDRILKKDGKPALGKPVLLGITKAALTTDSFISAASFQETTRVLTEAAINGREDNLLGLKENVIVGRLIPAGSGFEEYRDTFVISPKPEPVVVGAPEPASLPREGAAAATGEGAGA